LSCLKLDAEQLRELELRQTLASSPAQSSTACPLAASPGSHVQSSKALLSGSSGGAAKVSSGAPKPPTKKVRLVVDGRGTGDAPSGDDFAAPPFVPRMKRGRAGRVPSAPRAKRSAESAEDVSGAVRGMPVARGGRGRGRGRAADLAVRALVSNIQPLMRHARVVSERPVAQSRAQDDVEDAVDDEDGAADSDEPLEHEQDADDDEPSAAEHAEAAALFDHSCWSVYAAEGVSAVFADAPLHEARTRGTSDFGVEVPSFSRQDYAPGAIKTKIKSALDERVPQACTSTLQFVRLLFTDELVDKLVRATNLAAAEHPRCKDLVRILTYCTKCNVPLCLAHFAQFHTLDGDEFPASEHK
jgi:hypothetical protein